MRLVCRWCGYEAPEPGPAQCPDCQRIARWRRQPEAGEPSTLTFTYMDKKFLKLLHIDPEH